RERVGEITLPALILQGSDDAMIQGSHYLRMRLPKNKFYEFPGIGHMLVHEATDWVLPAIVDFISPQFHPQRGGGRTADY
ncbi:MAG: alpha/beta hydrolase, partial [Planctomycetes bacterium]|nr:alpha/beta hydrolase [Planctomycetota bacterium]